MDAQWTHNGRTTDAQRTHNGRNAAGGAAAHGEAGETRRATQTQRRRIETRVKGMDEHDGQTRRVRQGEQEELVSQAEYEALARFRRALRQFLRFSELAARAEGLTPQQHQLLLAVKGAPEGGWPTIGELADALQLHHSAAVQLVDRSQALGYVERVADREDRRVVRVHPTPLGEAKLARLTSLHRAELRRLRGDLAAALAEFDA